MTKTHCANGHEFSAENTAYTDRKDRPGAPPKRRCRECSRLSSERQREKRRKDAVVLTPEQRFIRKLRYVPSGCLEWEGFITADGYGMFRYKGRMQRAARVAYELFVGPIPEGLQLDHLCRNRPCANHLHLEPVTPQVNSLRGDTRVARQAAQTHCLRGHEFNDENTYRAPGNPRRRYCRACIALRRVA